MACETVENENNDHVLKTPDTDSDDEGKNTEPTVNTEKRKGPENTVDPLTRKVNEIDIKIINEDNVEIRVKTGEGTSREVEGEENQKKRRSSELDAANSEREKSVSPHKKINVSPTTEKKVGLRKSSRLKGKPNKLSPSSMEGKDTSSNSESEEDSTILPKEKKFKVGTSPEKEEQFQQEKEKSTEEGSEKKDETGKPSEEMIIEDLNQDRNPILRSLLNKPPLIKHKDLGDFYKTTDK